MSEAPYAGLLSKLKGIKAGEIDVGELSTAAVNHLYSSLTGIKDEAAVQANLPVQGGGAELDQLSGLLSQLSPENRKLLADTFASIKPNLDQLLDRALDSWRRSDHQTRRRRDPIETRRAIDGMNFE